jgi:LPPG:FO 2-phospho-L-lactate transferase
VTYRNGRIVALAGGVGGAKLVQGLAAVVPGHDLTAIVNTADDFGLYGLHISPDLDTVMYTLAGMANPATGWGVAGDTRVTLDAIARYGEDPWFLVGDQDFATHILRTHRLRAGRSLSAATAELAGRLGIGMHLAPMSDDLVSTQVRTPDGWLAFQDYFVARRHEDDVLDVRFDGLEAARPAEGVIAAIQDAETIILCPSNPLVSIGPILAVPGIREAIAASDALVVAVSPIVGGKALKGPADRMLRSRGVEVSALGVAHYYEGLVDLMVIDELDRHLAGSIERIGMNVAVRQTIMGDAADRARLAGEIIEAIESLQTRVGQ